MSGSAQSISELLCEYYVLYYAQLKMTVKNKSTLPVLTLPMQPQWDSIPDFRLFALPEKRESIDPNFSRLELFKKIYIQQCKAISMEPSWPLLFQIDVFLTDMDDLIMKNMDLSKSRLSPSSIDPIAKAFVDLFKYQSRNGQKFVENMQLTSLDLSSNPIGAEGITSIGAIMDSALLLKSLNLNNTHLGVKGAQSLSSYLECNKMIQSVFLQENEMATKGSSAIIKAIKTNRNYTFLDLATNGIDEKICETFSDAFRSNPNLSGISLAFNKIGEGGTSSLVESMKKSLSSSIESLDLSGVEMGSSVKLVLQWLSQNLRMKSFGIGYNPLSEKAAFMLVEILKNPSQNLKKLDIRMCDIPKKPLEEICKLIGNLRHMEALYLSGNRIGKKAGAALSQSLEVNHALCILSIRNCNIPKSTMISLLQAIKKHPFIQNLDLAMNSELGTSNEVSKELEDLFLFARKLEDLNIAACQFSSSTIVHVINGISKNSTLIKLHLDANKIGKQIVKIGEALIKNKSLKCISLKKVEISKKDTIDFLTILETCGLALTLEEISLERNELEPSQFADHLKKLPNVAIRI